MYGGAASGRAGGSFGSFGGGTTPTSPISSTMSLQVRASWHTHKGMFLFIELCRYILFSFSFLTTCTSEVRVGYWITLKVLVGFVLMGCSLTHVYIMVKVINYALSYSNLAVYFTMFFEKNNIFLVLSIATAPIFPLCLSVCLLMTSQCYKVLTACLRCLNTGCYISPWSVRFDTFTVFI